MSGESGRTSSRSSCVITKILNDCWFDLKIDQTASWISSSFMNSIKPSAVLYFKPWLSGSESRVMGFNAMNYTNSNLTPGKYKFFWCITSMDSIKVINTRRFDLSQVHTDWWRLIVGQFGSISLQEIKDIHQNGRSIWQVFVLVLLSSLAVLVSRRWRHRFDDLYFFTGIKRSPWGHFRAECWFLQMSAWFAWSIFSFKLRQIMASRYAISRSRIPNLVKLFSSNPRIRCSR